MRGAARSGPDTAVVAAARDGDQRALDALVADSLPLVYNIVGRALNGHTDVDDVVQETLIRVVRGLPGLRDLEAYRSWLVAIAVRQVRDHEADRRTARYRSAELDVASELPDPASDFATVTILQLGLTDQRREVAEATRWLDHDDRALLALWWLEETGELGRADLAGALGLSARHAAVRVQRMKEQVQTAHTVVRALQHLASCPELRELSWDWDGVPSPLWRKRFARHIRSCPNCTPRTRGLIPLDRLLSGLPLIVVPAGFALHKLWSAPVRPELALSSAGSPGRTVATAAAAGVTTIAITVLVITQVVPGDPPPPPQAAPSSISPTPSPSPSRTLALDPVAPTRSASPPVAAPPEKKGVAVWNAPNVSAALAKSGASWYYTWASHHDGIATPRNATFIPMIRAAENVNPQALAQAGSAGPYLLSFNEPDLPAQANMTVEEALSHWPKLMRAGKILGSPGVAFGGDTPGGWLDRFMTGAKERGYRVDFITLHWYGADFRTQPAVSHLKTYLNAVYKRYGKPIWLTEYALIDFSNGTRYASDAEQAAFITASAKMLSTLPYVHRYAWFGLPAATGKPGSGLFDENGAPTESGRAFQAAK
ncbi:sigma-70 family RNA polymerase sigma factor [Acrocarpospora catenulata]|uniref:sigma-70 family RNA polymerase sigma factor n=1 Tax=Acrocarpospora catenulata TaxID=2836182 RepID=UPI001BDA1B3F|nr:sigma-70 family RNA polymerase sigma factor [Acrocarpospora catenulata]